jgi:hypothetical protein
VSRRLACVLTVAAVAGAASAQGGATTAPEMILPVDVALSAKHVRFEPASARRGSYVQFNVKNTTRARRIFVLAGRRIVIPARSSRLMAISFDVRGRYRYVSGAGASRIVGVFRVL